MRPLNEGGTRRTAGAFALAALALSITAACSSDNPAAPPGSTGRPEAGTVGTAPVATSEISDEERLAEAKAKAVAFFQAQAVNDFDAALEASEGAAARTIEWARDVNSLRAANDSGYQIPNQESPNARVQIDSLTKDGATWKADGFVELSSRPGTVASSSTTAGIPGTTEVSPSTTPSAYVTDLEFTGDGDALVLVDYRLDDVPYPVSQLFVTYDDVKGDAGDASGTVTRGRRDLDGSVQYLGMVTNESSSTLRVTGGTFTAASGQVVGTDPKVLVDPVASNGGERYLAVLGGAFPGGPGTLALDVEGDGGLPATTTGGTAAPRALELELPDFPALTPRPVNTIRETRAQAGSTSSPSSSTSTTKPDDEPDDDPDDSSSTTSSSTSTTRPGTSSSSTGSTSSTTSSSTTSTVPGTTSTTT